MIPIGIGLVFVGYCGVLWGTFIITGKNVGLKQLFGTAWPPNVPGAYGTGAATVKAGAS